MLVPNISDLKQEEIKESNKILIENANEKVELFYSIDPENEKERKKMITSIEGLIRRSPEYSAFIGYLKGNLNLTKCTFHPDVDISQLKKAKLEFHHYPFTLYDIVDTLLTKYLDDHTIINPFEIAEDVMRLHYELKVGLVPLSKTMHQLTHSGKKFINLKHVSQSYLKFIAEYSRWINDELIQNWRNLKDLSEKQDNGELEEDDILANISLEIEMTDVQKPTKIEQSEEIITA